MSWVAMTSFKCEWANHNNFQYETKCANWPYLSPNLTTKLLCPNLPGRNLHKCSLFSLFFVCLIRVTRPTTMSLYHLFWLITFQRKTDLFQCGRWWKQGWAVLWLKGHAIQTSISPKSLAIQWTASATLLRLQFPWEHQNPSCHLYITKLLL